MNPRISSQGLHAQVPSHLANAQVTGGLLQSSGADGTQVHVAVDGADGDRTIHSLDFQVPPHGADGDGSGWGTGDEASGTGHKGEGLPFLLQDRSAGPALYLNGDLPLLRSSHHQVAQTLGDGDVGGCRRFNRLFKHLSSYRCIVIFQASKSFTHSQRLHLIAQCLVKPPCRCIVRGHTESDVS